MDRNLMTRAHDDASTTRGPLRVRDHRLPLRTPTRIGAAERDRMDGLLVTAHDEGLTGFGETVPVPEMNGEGRAAILDALQQIAASAAEALPDPRTPGLFDDVPLGARVAVEEALVDLAARDRGRPLAEWLAGPAPASRVVRSSMTIPLVAQDQLETKVDEALDAGFRSLKVEAGLEIDDDMWRIRRVRERAGDSVEIRVDANQGWKRREARHALPGLRDLGVAFLEQPLGADDLEGHAMLRAADEVPIMLDESVHGLADAERAIRAGAADLLNIKLQKCGGPLTGLRIADLAAEAGWSCMVGGLVGSRVGVLHAVHLAAAHPAIGHADVDGHLALVRDPVVGGAELRHGRFLLDGSPGIGVKRVDPEA